MNLYMQAIVGGSLIGLAAALLLLFSGRVAGVSGILGNVLVGAWGKQAWRVYFLIGLLAAPLIYRLLGNTPPQAEFTVNSLILLLAGVLVGFGARLGSGCTSGHGVCGISNLSWRSLVATLTFMSTGAITVYIIRHGVA